jgi:hypothetical protein
MKTIGKKIGRSSQKVNKSCDSQTAFCELILRVGAMEERITFLEEKCKYPVALSWTSCSHTGQPYYVNLQGCKQAVAH